MVVGAPLVCVWTTRVGRGEIAAIVSHDGRFHTLITQYEPFALLSSRFTAPFKLGGPAVHLHAMLVLGLLQLACISIKV